MVLRVLLLKTMEKQTGERQTEVEHVVLVDENDNELGTVPKSGVHTADTPLHRGFSAFLFNEAGELLLQQRSRKKVTWPLQWSNSICGHPALGETAADAAIRRAKFELGLELATIEEVSPYRYCFTKDGVMENEICPILIGTVANEPAPNPDEVEAIKWLGWEDFLQELENNQADWTEWCREEVDVLVSQGLVKKFLTN